MLYPRNRDLEIERERDGAISVSAPPICGYVRSGILEMYSLSLRFSLRPLLPSSSSSNWLHVTFARDLSLLFFNGCYLKHAMVLQPIDNGFMGDTGYTS